jgi:squalene-hopene/tetraprenyl-beta-curcumene cyclase
MNSMELVRRQSTGARPHRFSERRSAPLFCTELAGPVRNSILRARQYLIGKQRDDGLWCGRQSTDASLPSLLIFWLAYCEREQSELGQQCAAKIIEQQTATGGWSLVPHGADDVSVSVQAYFALKLLSINPSCERLVRARNAIRQLGGADAADAETRLILALFSQVKYEHCVSNSPHRSLFDAEYSRPGSRAIVRTRRPVRDVGIERGVRELFLKHPSVWPIAKDSQLYDSDRIEAKSFGERHFNELVWHFIALQACGASDDGEMQACEDRLRELVAVDEDENTASPQLNREPFADTALVVRSLIASGVTANHRAVGEAIDAMREKTVAETEPLSIIGTCNSFYAWISANSLENNAGALPPGLDVFDDWSQFFPDSAIDSDEVVEKTTNDFAEHLLRKQNADGGWSEHRAAPFERFTSVPDLTGAALESLASVNHGNLQAARERAVDFLRESQQADGSWVAGSGADRIQATSSAVRGLLAVGASTENDMIAAGINWLLVHQHRDGGWCELTESSAGTPTAWAVLALVAAGKANHAAARRGANFLVEAQADDGRWSEPEFAVHNPVSNRWVRNDLHSVAWPLLALSRWAVAAISAQSAATDATSLRLVGVSVDD